MLEFHSVIFLGLPLESVNAKEKFREMLADPQIQQCLKSTKVSPDQADNNPSYLEMWMNRRHLPKLTFTRDFDRQFYWSVRYYGEKSWLIGFEIASTLSTDEDSSIDIFRLSRISILQDRFRKAFKLRPKIYLFSYPTP